MNGSPQHPKIFLTGANGFVGKALVPALREADYDVRAALRQETLVADGRIDTVAIPDLSGPIDWAPLLDGIDAVVHLAGIAHATDDIPEQRYFDINTNATQRLAEAAVKTGVRRFVFMSSVRAQSGPVSPVTLTEESQPAPTDAYGRSKLAAERSLSETLTGTATTWCALRPVLVYGPGVKGNMRALANLARKPIPLPLGSLRARRSLISNSSLAGAVIHAIRSKDVAGRAFLAAEQEALTVPDMVAAIRNGLGRSPGLIPVPESACAALAAIAGKAEAWRRISNGLVADPAQLMATGWRPIADTRQQLAQLAASGDLWAP